MRFSLLFALAFLALPASAQPCEHGSANATLDIGNVRAELFNTGTLFWNPGPRGQYEVPKGGGVNGIRAGALWIGGKVNGDVRLAGSEYSQNDFWPGPLNEAGDAPEDCVASDRIWTVTLAEIAHYNATGEATADLAEWPADLGAPVQDGDGITDNYDLAAGDRPAIHGDQTAWWVQNDRGGTHEFSRGEPLGIEVRTTAYATSQFFADTYTSLAQGSTLPNVTFYRIEVTNRNAVPIEDALVGFWTYADLGNPQDNYIGCDVKRGIGYVYNRDDYDEPAGTYTPGYGENPPAVGTLWIGGPADEAHYACASYTSGNTVDGNPNNGAEAYHYLKGQWRDGSSFRYGGNGYQTGFPVRSLYTGTPPDFWTLHDIDGLGTADFGRYYPLTVVSHGPFDLAPSETQVLDLALAWSRGGDGAISSVHALREDAVMLRTLYSYNEIDPNGEFPFSATPGLNEIQPSDLPTAGENGPEPASLTISIAPNPALGATILRARLAEPATRARLAVYDLLGREVAVVHEGPLGAGEQALPVETHGWAPGVYLARLETEAATVAHRFVVAR